MTTIKDSGVREAFETGSVRDTEEGKGRFDLLPYEALHRLALHYQAGAKKYADRNWEKGQQFSRVVSSMLRHGFQFLAGKRDEDHLAAVVWNAFALMTYQERIKAGSLPADLDNLPRPTPQVVSDEVLVLAPFPTVERPPSSNAEQAAIAQAHNVFNACDVEEAIQWAFPADSEEVRKIWNSGCPLEVFVGCVKDAILDAQNAKVLEVSRKLEAEVPYPQGAKGAPPSPCKYLVYVSGPYRAPTPEQIQRNVDNAAAVAAELWKWGYSVICPHLNTHEVAHIRPEITGEEFVAGDLTQVERCDAVVFLPGWSTSEGTMQEMIHARLHHIPVLAWTEAIRPGGRDWLRSCIESDSSW